MRLFPSLMRRLRLFRQLAPGNIHTGKHQVKRIITRKQILAKMTELAEEETTMRYLRTPYLTEAEEDAYVKVQGKDSWMYPYKREFVDKRKKPLAHRLDDTLFEHVKHKHSWE
ncbi:Uncharacterised protein g916 [Pycnogonum litorale]